MRYGKSNSSTGKGKWLAVRGKRKSRRRSKDISGFFEREGKYLGTWPIFLLVCLSADVVV
jgi:hypothetical protein